MNRGSAVVLAASLILMTACAYNHAATTPVSVTVTSETANQRFISDVRTAALRAIREQVPEARPMTVAVNLDVTSDVVADPHNALTVFSGNQRVASTGPDPTGEGATPTVPANGWTSPRTITSTAVFISYTIHDASGRLVESKRLRLGIDLLAGRPEYAMVRDSNSHVFKDPFLVRRAFLVEASDFLASRVKALSQ